MDSAGTALSAGTGGRLAQHEHAAGVAATFPGRPPSLPAHAAPAPGVAAPGSTAHPCARVQGKLFLPQLLPSGLAEAPGCDGIIPLETPASLWVSQPSFLRLGSRFDPLSWARPDDHHPGSSPPGSAANRLVGGRAPAWAERARCPPDLGVIVLGPHRLCSILPEREFPLWLTVPRTWAPAPLPPALRTPPVLSALRRPRQLGQGSLSLADSLLILLQTPSPRGLGS